MMPTAHEQEARRFHEANPHILEKLKALALQAHRRRVVYGIRTLWEVMRWERSVLTDDPNQSIYKLNDHYHSFYARLLMDEVPELKGFFKVRK